MVGKKITVLHAVWGVEHHEERGQSKTRTNPGVTFSALIPTVCLENYREFYAACITLVSKKQDHHLCLFPCDYLTSKVTPLILWDQFQLRRTSSL